MDTASVNETQAEFWAKIDALQEAQVNLGLFDPQVLAPLDWLAGQGDTSSKELLQLVEEGVLPKRRGQDGQLGFTIFAEAQIRFMNELRKMSSYPEAEIKHAIRYENHLMEFCFLEVSPYDDRKIPDLEHFNRRIAQELEEIVEQEYFLRNKEHHTLSLPEDIRRQLEEITVQEARLERLLLTFRGKSEENLTHYQRRFYQKQLFRLRWMDEWFLTLQINEYEAQIRQGYSPEFVLLGHMVDENGHYQFGPPEWTETLSGYQDSRSRGTRFPLRTPDFTLSEDGLTLKTGISVGHYSEMSARYRIDEMSAAVSKLGKELWNPSEPSPGTDKCVGCGRIFESDNPKRKYCSKECRESAKHRRWRQRDPERARVANARYYARYYSEQIDDDI